MTAPRRRGRRTASRALLSAATAVAVVAAGLAAAPGTTAAATKGPDGQPRPRPAPTLPTLPDVPSRWSRGDVLPLSVPAAASTATGVWVVWGVGSRRRVGTEVHLPAGSGVPLLADWNGDGVATPGRYDAGQWFITNAAANSPQWESKTTFGGDPADVPVAGDIDGDGKAEVGVFRNGEWLWQNADGSQAAPIMFGRAGDTPVLGDWDGDGKADLGVARSGEWYLRMTGVTAKPQVDRTITVAYDAPTQTAVLQFAFGSYGDLPVVGDWDRDGRDEPGVVQDRRTWVLSGGLGRLRPTTKQLHGLNPDETALVGTQATANGYCPSATYEGQRVGKRLARQVKTADSPKGNRSIDGMQETLGTLQDGLRYVVTNDLTDRLRSRVDVPYYDPLSTHRTLEESVRRSANSALAAAIAVTTSQWTTINNISRKQLIDYARWHIRSLACEHGAVTPGGWGNTWQSALWAVSVGQAAWMLWPNLTKPERAMVAAMVSSEAEYASARGPRYHRTRLGKDLTPGDSQADEVSWDLLAPALAMAMMPNSPHYAKWRDALIAMAIAAFSRPGDLHREQTFNGVRPDIRLPGTNANEDGTVINHGIVNPDYVQNVEHLWWAASLLRTAGQPVPEALFMNADIVYRALAVVQFPSPPYAAPGGTVYQPGGQIYYPMGVSWGVRRPATFVGVDAFANAYAAPDTNAAAFLAAHARDARALQLRWKDGHMYAEGNTEESYRLGKEEYALQQMALAWWASAVKTGLRMTVDRTAYPGISLGVGIPLK